MVGHACLISRPQYLLGINQLEIGIFGATSFVFYGPRAQIAMVVLPGLRSLVGYGYDEIDLN